MAVLLGHFPPVYCELFEIHCSKLKLDPVANLCQTWTNTKKVDTKMENMIE